ncbi:MAG: Eco57I restriction-modification methylase domain-containing protein [Candidatus Marinimicrobia bacterium]|nr:Eco57I restriction-modification methylase domain-containing protein [Candidatus Neomarinimicrobiota bacterium]
MTKLQLQQILSAPFELETWRDTLAEIFNVKNFHQQPQQISLPANDKAAAAYELGSFITEDDRLIGLYQVNVLPGVMLERNKVGLRGLLRKVYNYDVDGALIVFVQDEKWRLSFVSEIRALDEEGNIAKIATEPKRYTYLLGRDEKTRTPVDRLYAIAGKPQTLEDIRNAFSVEALNEEFYKTVARYFYQLVGATAGKGKKAVTYERILELPGVDATNNNSKKLYQEFAVRLIGRIIFCWFLKMKKSDDGIPLMPEDLLSSQSVQANANYYHTILERLFFQTLNTPMEERVQDLPRGCEITPFLNGGLFEPHPDDFYLPDNLTGLNKNLNTLRIPDEWFLEFFTELEKYNFTIDENSVVDIEVSVDPEMLGRIFENLLAEIDPDSGETARKATGSYYTPREIVDYMAAESLLYYLNSKTAIEIDRLRPIFKMDESVSFRQDDKEKILDALDKLTVLDPACGSGAFPIGVMQKIVMALQKLDPNAAWWKERQISRIENAILQKQVREKLDTASVEYARKLGIIQNSLFGVDIQPIAAEISKLRCFLTLVVDETIDDSKPNRGVEALPNLEFKFVTADTLIPLPEENGQGSLFDNYDDINNLRRLRKTYLQSYGQEKEEIKERFLETQKKIFMQQIQSAAASDERALKISMWNPFDHSKTDWFDPEWMFGERNFDIVIGNPPYISAIKMKKKLGDRAYEELKSKYVTAKGTVDIYVLFIECGISILSEIGILCFITPNRYLSANYGKELRRFIYKNTSIKSIADYSSVRVFKKASTYPVVTILQRNTNNQNQPIIIHKYKSISIEPKYWLASESDLKFLPDLLWGFLINDKISLVKRMVNQSININVVGKINATSTAKEADEYHQLLNEKKGQKLINTGTIDRYTNKWGKEKLTDKGVQLLRPYLDINSSIISKRRKTLYL